MNKDLSIVVLKDIVKPYFNEKSIFIEPVEAGVSTNVYKIRDSKDVFYLRISQDPKESHDPEVLVYKKLTEIGIKVPDVKYYENYNEKINASFMIVKEIKGYSLYGEKDQNAVRKALYEAGKQIATVNSIPLRGFGWIYRYKSAITDLVGMNDSYKEDALEDIDKKLSHLKEKNVLSENEIRAVYKIIDKYPHYLEYKQGYLAHGDFDTSHIYANHGKYTGIIDFGDIRSTNQYCDIGHFYIYGNQGFEDLLRGYTEIIKLPDDYMLQLYMTMLFFLIRREIWIVNFRPNDSINNRTKEAIKTCIDHLI